MANRLFAPGDFHPEVLPNLDWKKAECSSLDEGEKAKLRGGSILVKYKAKDQLGKDLRKLFKADKTEDGYEYKSAFFTGPESNLFLKKS